MARGKPFTLEERRVLEECARSPLSYREIGLKINRPGSSVAMEYSYRGGRPSYKAEAAHTHALSAFSRRSLIVVSYRVAIEQRLSALEDQIKIVFDLIKSRLGK